MFISEMEKLAINARLTGAYQKIEDCDQKINNLQLIVDALTKAQVGILKKSRKGKKLGPVIRTPEAPYGLKKDGTPRKPPGMRKKVVEVTQP